MSTDTKVEKCGEPAAVRVFWPGKPPLPSCPEHHLAALQVAAAMGFYLHFDNVPGIITTCEHAKS